MMSKIILGTTVPFCRIIVLFPSHTDTVYLAESFVSLPFVFSHTGGESVDCMVTMELTGQGNLSSL